METNERFISIFNRLKEKGVSKRSLLNDSLLVFAIESGFPIESIMKLQDISRQAMHKRMKRIKKLMEE